MSDNKYGNRVTDVDKTQEIEALIAKEGDESRRTLLLVVHSLNASIREQTAAQLSHQTKLDDYILEQQERTQKVEAFINQGKGVKMVLGWGMKILIALFTIINSLALAIGSHYVTEIDNLQELAQINNTQHAEMYARMRLPTPRQVTVRKSMPDEDRKVK